MKTIYLEPAWKSPLSVQHLVLNPPEGYKFVASKASDEIFFRFLAKYDVSYKLLALMGNFIPVQLLKSEFDRLKSPSKETILTYSLCHLVLRKESWVLDMTTELPYILAWTEGHLHRCKDKIRKVLSSDSCKRIICQVKKGREAFLATFGDEFSEKVEVAHWGVPPRNFEKQYGKDKIKILFVNSGNINTAIHFYGKGGAEIVESFKILSQRYDNVELVIRSGMPESLKKEYSLFKNVKIIDEPIPWSELEKEWKSADIFVIPNHVNTPAQVFLDAMSYELPVVTTDTWANSELIENGKTGFLVHNPKAASFTEGSILHLSSGYIREIVRRPSLQVVEGLVDKLSILIENPNLRRKMGETAREEIESGKFSLKRENEKLRRILDEAT